MLTFILLSHKPQVSFEEVVRDVRVRDWRIARKKYFLDMSGT